MPSKSEIFRTAWDIARNGAARFGGSPRQHFAEALRMAYRADRKLTACSNALVAAGKGWTALPAPDTAGKWLAWTGYQRRSASEAASILRRAGFVTFARGDAFGVLAN